MTRPPKSFSVVRLGKLLLVLGFAAYMGLCTYMALAQRSFLYFPQVFSPATVDQMAVTAKLQRWTNSTGANIGFLRRAPGQPARGSVLITYGNARTALDCADYADELQAVAPLDIYILEYPGYEDRPGKPSEKALFDAASEAFQMVPTNQPIYLLGESLGTGVASYLAGTYPDRIAGVILISPFDKITNVAANHYPFLPVSLLMLDRFPSDEYLKNYHGKVGITVDGRDTVIPEKFGLSLYNGYAGPKKLWQFPDGVHCQITGSQTDFWKEAVQLLQTH